MICDLPYKAVNAITFNLPLYFMTNLRREPRAFFIFLLFSFVSTLTMSMIYRTIGAASRTLAQALVPAAIILLALIIYAGFILPVLDMGPWFRWINYLNPIAYSFESLMLNEFYGRSYPCSTLVPQGRNYLNIGGTNQVCSAVGATAGSNVVLGGTYLWNSFRLSPHHLWRYEGDILDIDSIANQHRNLGIIFAFMVFYMITYLYSTEYISAAKSKGEILLFRRGQALATQQNANPDIEMAPNAGEKLEEALNRQVSATIQQQTAIFQWKDICYDIKIKKETRRILDHVDGWVKPGTLTALMVSEKGI
jgi:ATP-binding cassette, subfamily G (WHITE), member 2, PDR